MMQMSLLSIVMMLIAGGGGGNDLLDFVPTKAYWKMQGVELSVAALAEQLVAPEDANKAADSAKRQMALRALGELKDEAGLPAIEPYLKSPDPLLADYAKEARAAIKGEAFTRRTVSKDDLRNDLTLLPSGLGAIGGMRMEAGAPMDLTAEMKKLGTPGLPDPEEAEAMIVESIAGVSSMVGNFRLGAVTFGIASDVGDDSGSVVLIVRGLYNSKALDAMLGDRIGGVRKKAGGLTYHELDSNTAYVAPVSDELLVFTVGANAEALPLAEGRRQGRRRRWRFRHRQRARQDAR